MATENNLLSLESELKYQKFILACLEKKDGLAVILHKLVKYGVDYEIARQMVIKEAFQYSIRVKRQSTGKIILALISIIALFIFGVRMDDRVGFEIYAYSAAPGIYALYIWRFSKKRIDYLSSIK